MVNPNDCCFMLCCMMQKNTERYTTLGIMTPLYVSQQCVIPSLPLTDTSLASKEGFPTM